MSTETQTTGSARDHPPEEWLVSWLPMDGGAILLKEQSVTDIPDGLEQEY